MVHFQIVFGNICIAGHNYDNGKLFSKVPDLEIGDFIYLTDLTHSTIKYVIYDKYEIDSGNTNCTAQNTNNKRELTLVTCNNITGNRIIIKAK